MRSARARRDSAISRAWRGFLAQDPSPPSLLVVGMLALALGACRSVDHGMYNLREVVHPDGRAKRTGRPMGRFEYGLRSSFDSLNVDVVGWGDGVDDGAPVIKDPLGDSLEALIELDSIVAEDVLSSGRQVEAFTWMTEPGVRYVLARERAALGLGPIGKRLGVPGPQDPPPDQVPAGIDEVAAALRGLLGALELEFGAGEEVERAMQEAEEPLPQEQSLFDGGPSPDTGAVDLEAGSAAQDTALAPDDDSSAASEPLDLAAASDALLALDFDRYGARRALALLNTLIALPNVEQAHLPRLEELSWEIQRRCVGLALSGALRDPHPLVAAAAVEASVIASDNTRADIVRAGLMPVHPTVLLRALELVRDHGIPGLGGEFSEEDRAANEEDILLRLLSLTRHPDNHASAAACRALGAVSDAGFQSLQFEDWVRWWRERPEIGS